MSETYGIYVLGAGVLLALAGYVWLLLRAWRLSWRWTLALLLFPPATLIFLCVEFRRVTVPATVLLLGLFLAAGTVGLNLVLSHYIDLGPREKDVDGELHITLTGWDKQTKDYALLVRKPETVVLQMANADVTDEILRHLSGLKRLQELDLNDTQISDGGLHILAELPYLRVLRLRGTKVTDQGFRDHLLGKKSLLELDARETTITSKTLREWRNIKKDQRRYLK
jgi:hypothetical protein